MWKNLKKIDKDLYDETFELDRSLLTNNVAVYVQLQFIAERLLKFIALKEKINSSYEDENSKETLGSLLNNQKIIDVLRNLNIDIPQLKKIQDISNKLKHSELEILFEIDVIVLLIKAIYILSVKIGNKYFDYLEESFNEIYFKDIVDTKLSDFINSDDTKNSEFEKVRIKKELDSIDIKELENEKIKEKYIYLLGQYKELIYQTSKDTYILELSYDLKENRKKLHDQSKKYNKLNQLALSLIILVFTISAYFIIGLIYRQNNPYIELLENILIYEEDCYIDQCGWLIDFYDDLTLTELNQTVDLTFNINEPLIYYSYFPENKTEGRESFYLYTQIFLRNGIIDIEAVYDDQTRLDLIYDYNKDIATCEDYNNEDFITCEKSEESLTTIIKIFNSAFESIYFYNDYYYNDTDFLKKYMDHFKIGKLLGYY